MCGINKALDRCLTDKWDETLYEMIVEEFHSKDFNSKKKKREIPDSRYMFV